MRSTLASFGCILMLMLGTNRAIAQTYLVDDFDDGNDDGWTYVDPVVDFTFDASNFEYTLQTSEPRPRCEGGLSSWDASADDPMFASGFFRAKVRANMDGTGGNLVMRGDMVNLTGYGFQLDTVQSGSPFKIVRFDGNRQTVLAEIPRTTLSFDPGEEWYIESGAVGDQLSLKVWRVGELEPDLPQLTTTDPRYSEGLLVLTAGRSCNASGPGLASLTYDDVTFTVPEASANALALLGSCGLVWLRPRRYKNS